MEPFNGVFDFCAVCSQKDLRGIFRSILFRHGHIGHGKGGFTFKKSVEGGDILCTGTAVGVHGKTLSAFGENSFFGRKVGFDITVAETVDRLPGVAHHKKSTPRVFQKDFFKNFKLRRVGILKFIDQTDGEFFLKL